MNSRLNFATQVLFERGGVRVIFDHVRNLLVATIVVAAGLDTAKRSGADAALHIFVNPVLLSYVVVFLGIVLIAVNFFDGLHKLRRFRWHVLLQFAMGLAYLVMSVRMVQIVVFFRTHGC
ncbi:hypothetical protein [Luteibacter sp. dw_328]|uniref:hypothetical protein n=1 Tax=Luteibacter sp. dw_328 TaxID=2719796 RepID=UPI001BD57162|nr:hypothetical protein [Luteibacter sp. dw_328]